MGHFDYGELLAIIEGYITGSSLGDRNVLESDLIIAINSLTSNDEDISKLGSLSVGFRNSIDVSSISLSMFIGQEIARPIY